LCVCAAGRETVLNSETFKTLSESKMSAAVAAAMNYLTKRGDGMTGTVTVAVVSI